MITSVVLTRNEQDCIEKCLRSLVWCDEILVIDDFSTDGTIGIIGETCLPAGRLRNKVRIIQKKSTGNMAEIRNFALEKAAGEWVFFVDADEIVTKELESEIEENIRKTIETASGTKGFMVPRKDFFLGRFLKYGEAGKIQLLRLGKRESGKWERGVHETWKIAGKVGELSSALEHFSHRTISQFIGSINRWTDFDVSELNQEGKKFAYYRVLVNPIGKFIQNYFFRLGFLDVWAGFVMAYLMSLQSLIVRVKQYELREK